MLTAHEPQRNLSPRGQRVQRRRSIYRRAYSSVKLVGVLTAFVFVGASCNRYQLPVGHFSCDPTVADSCPPGWVCQQRGNDQQPYCYQREGAFCGDGFLDEGETCDGTAFSGANPCSTGFPICRENCTVYCTVCGNGIVELTPAGPGEECDGGEDCGGDCLLLDVCGNGRLDPGEACDDGNRVDRDGCNSICSSNELCGNGYLDVTMGEECDDGNSTDYDGCHSNCTFPYCGNRIIDDGEVCDDGNHQAGDGCDPLCKSLEVCGNDIIDDGVLEQCDDGNTQPGDGCSADCRNEVCGNGVQDINEACDDGNNAPGDGCSADCQTVERCGNGVVDFASTEQCDDGNHLSHDGCSSDCLFEQVLWSELEPLRFHDTNNAAYDASRGTSVLWHPDGVWEYSARQWRFVPQAFVPAGQFVYDPVSGHVVSVQGQMTQMYRLENGTWTMTNLPTFNGDIEYLYVDTSIDRLVVATPNGTTGTIDHLQFDNPHWTLQRSYPPHFYNVPPLVAYDSARQVLVALGESIGGAPGETWEFVNGYWTLMADAYGPPASSVSSSMVYDAAHQRVVLVYGADTWEYASGQWSPVISSSSPPARIDYALLYDATQGVVVLHGGRAPQDLSDTWELDGANWAQTSADVPTPSRRAFATLSSRWSLGGVMLVGGGSWNTHTADTWWMDGVQWSLQSSNSALPARAGHAVATRPIDGAMLLFGGEDDSGLRGDTWWNPGSGWQEVWPTSSPAAREGHGVAYDSAHQRFLLFGGRASTGLRGDLWSYDGTWQPITVAGGPSARTGHCVAYDPVEERLVVFGGEDDSGFSNELWFHSAGGWTHVSTTVGPSPRRDAALAVDPFSGRIYLFGGFDGVYRDDLWLYTSGGWTPLQTPTRPTARSGHGLAYDVTDRGLVLHGGETSNGSSMNYLGDTWKLTVGWGSPHEDCINWMDDDSDALMDCADPDCSYAPYCL